MKSQSFFASRVSLAAWPLRMLTIHLERISPEVAGWQPSIFVSTVIQEGVLQMMNMLKMCVIEEGGRTCLYAEDVLMLGSLYVFVEVEGGI